MDREKVVKGLENTASYFRHLQSVGFFGDQEIYYEHEKHCNDALALLKEQEWNILTEDADGIVHGLPGDDGTYLMTDGKDIWIDDYVDCVYNGIFLYSGRDIHDIKAWMYMPKLPKEDR